ncbi:ABC-2 type transport system ATP-binding protein [Microcella putealis]|uniref:ABC-2 type transport system ATP-binding protein n=1 Tax=Microcella putealis TaxID=337005 RepID=A0A4Q7LSA0_9MICO|nr:ABC transporter ATP-binding protein [Microcella putealis]RZS57401.1 ABC-2 type transport system ATP-binding protein [Microcella putealis]TQM19456.1 ABC-2 type transport system ATP-binding protein [Microcella putealis]
MTDTAHASATAPGVPPEVVVVKNVSKRFVLRKDNSLKERLVTLGRLGRKHREEFWALNDINLSINAGTTIGLIGHNGSGKSTLLKVIGGIIGPSSGTVATRGRIAALLELGAGFHPDLTGRENVYLNASILGMSRRETDEKFDQILLFAGIGDFIDTQVKFYSSGMYVRLAFAVAVHTDPDILLVDEVLAVGDEAFQRKCLDTIRRFQQEGRTIVLVTHSLGQVQEFCDRAILLERGNVAFDGPPEQAVPRFRDLLEENRKAEESAVAVVTGVESTAAPHITAVCVGTPGSPAAPGEEATVESGANIDVSVTIAATEALSSWMLGIQINNVHGQAVFGVGSDLLNTDLPELLGEVTVTTTLSNPMFGEGKYFVDASVIAADGTHLADVTQAASFNVVTPRRSRGTLFADARMTVETA